MGFQVLLLLLLFIYPLCSAQNTYYVTPTADTPCPGEPCFSLSEYITGQAGQNFTSGLTFVFLPGNHTIEINVPIVELPSLSLLGDSSSLPELTSIVICTQPIGFTFSQLSELSISNIGFISCGDVANALIRLEQVLQAEISNCLFQGGQNGALSVIDSTVYLLENRFENNSATIGGGLYIDRSAVNLTRNIFTENYAQINGSGVYIESSHQSESTVSFTENSFIANSADGSGLYIESGRHSTVSFTENSFIRNSGDGVVVFVGYSNEVTFTENEFLNNSGSDIVYESSVQISTFYVKPTPNTPCPGEPCHTLAEYILLPNTSNAMLVFLPGNSTLETSIFLEGLNSLTLSGDSSSHPHITSRIICSQPASIIFSNINELHITDMALISCGNLADASVRIYQVYRAEISSCIFQGERSGALAVVDSSVILFNNTFESNSATTGGGVYIDRSTVNSTRNTFTDNVASINGAGVFVGPQPSSRVSFIQNRFINNRGGGATVYVDHSSEITAFVGNTFANNTADTYAVYGSTSEEASIYYVTPALDIPCPLQPCHTLSHYITESHQYFTSNTTLVFIPGNHSLEKGLLIRDITSLAMIGNSSAFISSNIVCNTNKPESFTFYNISEVHIHSLAFISCGSSTVGAAVSLSVIYLANISSCTFHNNINRNYYGDIGGALAVVTSTLTLSETTFTNNIANSAHGGSFYTEKSNVTVIGSTFVNNSANDGWGGGVYGEESMVTFVSNLFKNNIASYGGGVEVYNSVVNFTEDTVINNVAGIDGGGLDIYGTTGNFKRIIIQNNTAQSAGGGVSVYPGSSVSFSEGTFMFNTAGGRGGGILVVGSTSILNVGESNWTNNSAGSRGGGGYFGGGTANFHMNNIINNTAKYGGGFYVLESEVHFIGSLNLKNNVAVWSGGGIYASSASRLYFNGTTNFIDNSASDGGGLHLTENSLCYFSSEAELYFIENHATKHGGALNNEDSKTSAYCSESETSPSTTTRSNCFFQVWTDEYLFSLSEITARMDFYNNIANDGGSDVYGGMVDSCKLNNISVCQEYCKIKSSGDVFDIITGGKLNVSSTPLQVCSCDHQKVNCSHSPTVRVYPGRQFSVKVIVLGQRNGTVPCVIETKLSNSNITISDNQKIQKTRHTQVCTDLIFTVHMNSSSQRQQNSNLTLNTNGPCPLELVVQIEVLVCPHGFEIHDNDDNCDCDKRLTKFTDECDIETGTILKKSGSEFWVGCDNVSQGLILHPHCPFDYCETDELYIDVDDSDAQCSYNRSGVLCGECGQNLSLVFGSSRCTHCSNSHLALLFAFTFAGIALVLLLFILRLTVAIGTLHGLIFYANIVQVNSAIFFPSGHANPLTVFISWLNLDLGIETCFYRGMDAYSKIWLQFVFPIYVWSLVVIIISVSHYSTGKVARLFGRNPIAVLATLFLLSYAKLLRTIIAALSVTYVEYPNNSHVAVWLYDGNIKYLGGKHVPLFIVAIVFLLFLFLPYTLLLLLSQWLQLMPKISFFSSNYRIKPFLDAYHAPYNDKHRYWIGLFLCIRCVLFLTVIYNALGDPSVNLLSISSAVVGLLTLTSFFAGTVYKNCYVGALETSFLLNLGILAVSTYHVRATGGNQAAVTFTLLSIAFATFAGTIVYHIIMQVSGTKCWGKTRLKHLHKYYNVANSSGEDMEEFQSVTSPIVTKSPTYSTVELSIRDSVTQLM